MNLKEKTTRKSTEKGTSAPKVTSGKKKAPTRKQSGSVRVIFPFKFKRKGWPAEEVRLYMMLDARTSPITIDLEKLRKTAAKYMPSKMKGRKRDPIYQTAYELRERSNGKRSWWDCAKEAYGDQWLIFSPAEKQRHARAIRKAHSAKLTRTVRKNVSTNVSGKLVPLPQEF